MYKWPKFRYFLEVFAAPSIERIAVSSCRFQRTTDGLTYLLHKTSNLKQLDLRDVSITFKTYTMPIEVEQFLEISRTIGLHAVADELADEQQHYGYLKAIKL